MFDFFTYQVSDNFLIFEILLKFKQCQKRLSKLLSEPDLTTKKS